MTLQQSLIVIKRAERDYYLWYLCAVCVWINGNAQDSIKFKNTLENMLNINSIPSWVLFLNFKQEFNPFEINVLPVFLNDHWCLVLRSICLVTKF